MRELDLIQHEAIKNLQGLGAGTGCRCQSQGVGCFCEQLAVTVLPFPGNSSCACKQASVGSPTPQPLTPNRPSHSSLLAGMLLKGYSGANKASGFLQQDAVLVGVGHSQLSLMPARCVPEQACPTMVCSDHPEWI